jgi:HEAT repeat protein
VLPDPVVLKTPTHWLIDQAFAALNAEGERAEAAYKHVAELLKTRKDAAETLLRVAQSSPAEDVGRRWSALYVAGDIGDKAAAEPLYRVAASSLPEQGKDGNCGCGETKGCEGPRDGEVLVRTMAVEALQRVAERHEDARSYVLELIAAQPARQILVEAVKAARALGLSEEAGKRLNKDDRWMLDIKMVPVQEVMAEPERADDSALGYMAPVMRTRKDVPAADCCCTPSREG